MDSHSCAAKFTVFFIILIFTPELTFQRSSSSKTELSPTRNPGLKRGKFLLPYQPSAFEPQGRAQEESVSPAPSPSNENQPESEEEEKEEKQKNSISLGRVFIPADPNQLPRSNKVNFNRLISRRKSEFRKENETSTPNPKAPLQTTNATLAPDDTTETLPEVIINDDSPFEILLTNVKRNNGIADDPPNSPEISSVSSLISTTNLNQGLLDQPSKTLESISKLILNGPFQKPKLHSLSKKAIEDEITERNTENGLGSLRQDSTITEIFTSVLNSLGLEFNIVNPEIDIADPIPQLQYQDPIGGKCVMTLGKSYQGICASLENCPVLEVVSKQSEVTQVPEFFRRNVCRFEDGVTYFCCPFYTFSNKLPGNVKSVVNTETRSPQPVEIPPPSECGRRKEKANKGKVIGGTLVQKGDFPWIATIGTPLDGRRFQNICTGSAVSVRHVITAAHCFYTAITIRPTHVRLGEVNLGLNSIPRHQEFVIIGRSFPLYHKFQSINDIAVITLDRDIRFDDYVQPICLPYDFLDHPKVGEEVIAVGFGRQSRLPRIPESPRKINLEVQENAFCQQVYYGARSTPVVDHRTFCAGGKLDEGTCQGDSGGPVMHYDRREDQYILVGVVKGGGLCGAFDQPSINTKIAPFLPWIESVMKL